MLLLVFVVEKNTNTSTLTLSKITQLNFSFLGGKKGSAFRKAEKRLED